MTRNEFFQRATLEMIQVAWSDSYPKGRDLLQESSLVWVEQLTRKVGMRASFDEEPEPAKRGPSYAELASDRENVRKLLEVVDRILQPDFSYAPRAEAVNVFERLREERRMFK